ncbi:tetraacyldisaccharide 4'-kinase [Robertkochia solimangrovi]|uniref:tetraacyldisaccharide 4'-kinase n=1 Tax=Robertkochia solimangrovi TaxID=2213046 RepID=UPI00117C926B|nr:tetraacyldisaccharide 4'-kinase [Robertkochia solimangrovi]TRZ41498.1 tetraacyldisaccharide 4'-kinase [Robertkochia solimangrovi]
MRILRKLLLPFSWLYGIVVFIRNLMYDSGWLKSMSYDFPVICIGNLSVGGTGKSPMTEYVIRLLSPKFKIAVLSRGYKRLSDGFVMASDAIGVKDLGDEPYQYHRKFKDIAVAVDADRQNGINELRERTSAEVIILDDAFQHRKVKAGLNILLTVYGDIYKDDHLLPAGNLRDNKSQSKRADIIIVTKCPIELPIEAQKDVSKRLALEEGQRLYFSTITYEEHIYGSNSKMSLEELKNEEVTLVTGIANPGPLLHFLKSRDISFEHLSYPDHHNFSPMEIKFLQKKHFVLTTEKDFVRLEDELDKAFYLPIRTDFLENGDEFDSRLLEFAGNGLLAD